MASPNTLDKPVDKSKAASKVRLLRVILNCRIVEHVSMRMNDN